MFQLEQPVGDLGGPATTDLVGAGVCDDLQFAQQMRVAHRVAGPGVGVIRCPGVVQRGPGEDGQHPASFTASTPRLGAGGQQAEGLVEAEWIQPSLSSMRIPVPSKVGQWGRRYPGSTLRGSRPAALALSDAIVLAEAGYRTVRRLRSRCLGQELPDEQVDHHRLQPRPDLHRSTHPGWGTRPVDAPAGGMPW